MSDSYMPNFHSPHGLMPTDWPYPPRPAFGYAAAKPKPKKEKERLYKQITRRIER